MAGKHRESGGEQGGQEKGQHRGKGAKGQLLWRMAPQYQRGPQDGAQQQQTGEDGYDAQEAEGQQHGPHKAAGVAACPQLLNIISTSADRR